MSSGETHEDINIIAAFLISLFFLIFKLPLDILCFIDYGLVVISLWYSPDLDHEKSRPTKRWWIFKGIWKVFIDSGHREVLHNWSWGSVILCVIPALVMLPYVWYSRDFRVLWMLVGLVVSIWLHILTDKISGVKRWLRAHAVGFFKLGKTKRKGRVATKNRYILR